jgi:hypothetical protein
MSTNTNPAPRHGPRRDPRSIAGRVRALTADGQWRTSGEIARELGVRPSVVSTHLYTYVGRMYVRRQADRGPGDPVALRWRWRRIDTDTPAPPTPAAAPPSTAIDRLTVRDRVAGVLADGRWRTAAEITEATGAAAKSVSAHLCKRGELYDVDNSTKPWRYRLDRGVRTFPAARVVGSDPSYNGTAEVFEIATVGDDADDWTDGEEFNAEGFDGRGWVGVDGTAQTYYLRVPGGRLYREGSDDCPGVAVFVPGAV